MEYPEIKNKIKDDAEYIMQLHEDDGIDQVWLEDFLWQQFLEYLALWLRDQLEYVKSDQTLRE